MRSPRRHGAGLVGGASGPGIAVPPPCPRAVPSGAGSGQVLLAGGAPDADPTFDLFSKLDFTYPGAVATAKVGKGVKSEGELVVSGAEGYVYVPAPWWKTDYFEIRREDPADNRRFFYQLNGEGIRDELVAFARAVAGAAPDGAGVSRECSRAMTAVIERFYSGQRTLLA